MGNDQDMTDIQTSICLLSWPSHCVVFGAQKWIKRRMDYFILTKAATTEIVKWQSVPVIGLAGLCVQKLSISFHKDVCFLRMKYFGENVEKAHIGKFKVGNRR